MEYFHRNNWPWGKSTIINILDGAGTVKVTVEDDNPKMACISSLSVVPDKRHCGFGKQLLKMAEEEARVMGCTKVMLYAVVGEFTVEWYQREGYKVIDEIEHHYRLQKRL